MFRILNILIIILAFSLTCFSQSKLDSVLLQFNDTLKKAYSLEDDSLLAIKYREKADYYNKQLNNDSIALIFYDSSNIYYKKTNDLYQYSQILFKKAIILKNLGFPDKAIKHSREVIHYYKSIDKKDEIGSLFSNISDCEKQKGNFPKAIDYQFKSLKIAIKLDDNSAISRCYNQLAIIYKIQEDYNNALVYYEKALEINILTKHQQWVSYNYNNIANVYFCKKEYLKAIEYHNRALEIKKDINDIKSMPSSHINLGEAYCYTNDFEKSIYHLSIAEKMGLESGNQTTLAYTYMYFAKTYSKMNLIEKSKKKALQALNISRTYFLLDIENEAAELLYNINKQEGNYKQALEMRDLHIKLKDSLVNKENFKAIISKQYAHMTSLDSANHAVELDLQNQRILSQDAKLEKENTIRIALISGIILVVIFLFLIYSRFKVIRRQKDLIENQKIEVDSAYNLLEIKSEEIQDSIIYAKRIQVGILPSDELIKASFKESFIFYQPKDIVAGDFYWIDNSMEDNILFAVGDCTGHGVPGAMVSILCQSILNRVIVENYLIKPSKILDKTRVLLIENLKGGEIIKDGMDIALCSYNKKTKSMQFSGANRSLWIIRNDELIEIKGDHQPVGEFERANPFINNDVKLVNNDIIYLFSDGYVDQFGGEAGKKYKKTRFKDLLFSVCKESLSKQKEIISKSFESWKGNQEQVDDVLILGVKI